MSNSFLINARNVKNDEFYTQYSDVEEEINAYVDNDPDVFKGKTVLLPCDDPDWSNFTKFFVSNFTRLGLKKLISTSYVHDFENYDSTSIETAQNDSRVIAHNTRGRLFTLTQDLNSGNTSNVTEFSGYLEGDGDFRSDEVSRLRDESDIVITNPPFSLFRDFVSWVVEAEKKFLIMGTINGMTYKSVFPLFWYNKMWLGYRPLNKGMCFKVTSEYQKWLVENKKEGSAYRVVNGEIMGYLASICWFTNLDHGRRHEKLVLNTMEHNLKFNNKLKNKLTQYNNGKIEYARYDNYDAIDVPFVDSIPSDYDGVMGKYNPDQFEIVAFRKGNDGKDLVITTEREREDSSLHQSSCSTLVPGLIKSNDGMINGKLTYVRVTIRHKYPAGNYHIES